MSCGRLKAAPQLAQMERIDDQRNVAVARVVATVFGDLRAGRVNGADLRDPGNVWVMRVGERHAEEARGLVAGEDFPQAGLLDSDRVPGIVDRRSGMRPQVVLDEVSRRLRAV